MNHAVSELDRRVANVVRMGTITELDQATARVKVDVGDLVTDWLPWVTARAGATRTWSAPRPGEQVMVLAESGDLGHAVVLPSIFQTAHPAPANTQDVEHTEYPDGTTVDYNSATNTLTVTVAGTGNVVINCKHATVNATEDATVNTKASTINAENTAAVNTKTATVTASTKVELSTPLVHCTQALMVDGVITGKGGMAISGGSGATISGNLAATGGAFTHNGVNVGGTHKHSGVQTGTGTTGTPS